MNAPENKPPVRIRAKMEVVTAIPPSAQRYGSAELLEMSAVYGGTTNAEDNTYARATPSGGLKLTIDNPGAQGLFKPGAKCYVDVTLIEEPTS